MHEACQGMSDWMLGHIFRIIMEEMMHGIVPELNDEETEAYNKLRPHCYYKKPRIKGERHWNWKGGITPKNQIDRGSARATSWRNAVFKRDRYTCQICGTIGGKLNAHHIKPWAKFPEERYNIENGITLCRKCHKAVHSKKRCLDGMV